MEETETDCFRLRNGGRGKSQKECGWLVGERGKDGDKGDVRSSIGGSLGR